MGTLERMDTGERIALRSRVLLGRSAACDLRVEDPRVSSEHASLGWTGAVWEVRDLGSKNGTFVGERRLAAGERIPLLPGDMLALGAPRPPAPAFVLADGEHPAASARHTQTGVVRAASAGLLVLPDDENPRASLVEEHDGSWAIEALGVARLASDRETIVVDGEAWILDLPQRTSSTAEGSAGALTEVCRARKQFSALGIQGAASIVDRRMGTGRIRLGVERVDVRRM